MELLMDRQPEPEDICTVCGTAGAQCCPQSKPWAKIVEGPHALFTGGGVVTYGITAQSLKTGQKWDINEHSLRAEDGYADFLGLTPQEYASLLKEFDK
jgi:hypothetical protein